MVRHFVDTRRSQELVMLDPRSESFSAVSFEDAVEVAASICMAASLAKREPILVLPGQTEKANDERLQPIDRLTLVTSVSSVSLADAFSEVRRKRAGASALIIVTGDTDGRELIEQARRVLRSGLVVVVRVVVGTEPTISNVGGGRLVTVPSADRLAGVWAEAVVRA
jgi:hypothetical protein